MNQKSVAERLRTNAIQKEGLKTSTGEKIEMIKLEGQMRDGLSEVEFCWVCQLPIMRRGLRRWPGGLRSGGTDGLPMAEMVGWAAKGRGRVGYQFVCLTEGSFAQHLITTLTMFF